MRVYPKKRSIPLPGWLFTSCMAVYSEVLLHLWVNDDLQPGRILAVVLFALALGGVLGLLTTLLPRKGRKRAATTVSVFLAVIVMAEFMLKETFQNFMTVQTMTAGAGGIAQDFLGQTIAMIAANFSRILLILLPPVLYGIFCREPELTWARRGLLACGCILFGVLGLGTVYGLTGDRDVLHESYHFDGAVRDFGLGMGFLLDAVHHLDSSDAPDFAIPEVPPETSETAETDPEDDPEETEYDYNVLPIDFAAAAQAMGQGAVASIHNYVNSLTPSRQSAYTGMFRGKNLILITAEAFSAEVIDPELTPTLYRMATQGIQFKEYYQPAWGASTTTGEFSNLLGLVPTQGGSSMNIVTHQNMFLTMGHQLQKQGYYSVAYHDHLKDFYHRNNTHTHLGYDKFIARYGGLEIEGTWPESDLEMMQVTVPQYIDQQPFSIYYMTVSGHCEYSQKGNAMTRKNWDKVQNVNHSDIVKGYLAANLELEYAMESLLNQLEEAGIADDTLIVLATDHYAYGLERSKTWQNTVDHLAELFGVEKYDQFVRDHNALIMWSGCLEGKNIVVDTPVYSLDILPTVSNLFGVPYDSRLLVGRDVFSDAEPLVLWPDFNWITDKGTYCNGTFTPREGVSVDEDYIQRIKTTVKNKITFSQSVANTNYYDYVLKYMEENS